MGSAWPQGGSGWQAHRCHLPHKHNTAFHDQYHHLLFHVLCHPLPTAQKSSYASSDPLPIPLPAVTCVPKLKPSHFQTPRPYNSPTKHRGIYHTPASCAWSWAWRKESKADHKTASSSRSRQPLSHHSRAGWLATTLIGGLYLYGCSLGSQSCCWLASPLQEAENPETSASGSAQAELLG